MIRQSHAPSGRPADDEYAAYAKPDIDQVVGDDAVDILIEQAVQTMALLGGIDDAAANGLTYASGKWTLKEVLGHLIDDERIFAYRALSIARGESQPLPGFDQNAYVRAAHFEAQPLTELLHAYQATRQATIAFFAALSPDEWSRRGTVNGYTASVRGLAFHIAGHELRHLRTLRDSYLAQRVR